MKHVKLLALAGVLTVAANAYAEEDYAPEKGDFSIELQFNPFGDDFNNFLENQSFTGRYYISDKDAIRFGIGFGVNTKKNSSNSDDSSNLDNYEKTQTGNVRINLGYEHNVYSYKRINLYAGAGLGFGYYGNTVTNHSEYTNYDGGTTTTEEKQYNVNDDDLKAYTEFSVNAFTGIDFYLYKGLYVGAELGLKIGVQNYPAGKTETTSGNEKTEVKGNNSTTGFVLGTYAEPAIRLGWTF